jgi:hypothetical protein
MKCVDCGVEAVNGVDAGEDDISSMRWISRLDIDGGGENPFPAEWRGEHICFDCLDDYTGFVEASDGGSDE